MARSLEFCAIQIDHVAAISAGAVLVGFAGRQVWIPKSLIHEDDIPEERSPEPAEINIAAWFAKKEGMR